MTLFGVNLLSQDDIEEYFNEINFKIKKIYWINDFSCIVEFDSEELALNAYKELTGYEIKKDANDIDNYDWKTSRPFLINESAQEIQVRVSEVNVRLNINKRIWIRKQEKEILFIIDYIVRE